MSEPFLEFVDLASERLGASVVAANDEFFGEKDRLIAAGDPIWKDGLYTDRGKWVDGWETRRRARVGPRLVHRPLRRARHRSRRRRRDHALQGQLSGGVRDRRVRRRRPRRSPPAPRRRGTRCFRTRASRATRTTCSPSTVRRRASHLRLRIFPDGGVARLRVYGEVVPDWQRLRRRGQSRSCRGRTRRHRGGVERHVFRAPAQPHHAGRSANDGRKAGKRAAAGAAVTTGRSFDSAPPGTIERVEVDTQALQGERARGVQHGRLRGSDATPRGR